MPIVVGDVNLTTLLVVPDKTIEVPLVPAEPLEPELPELPAVPLEPDVPDEPVPEPPVWSTHCVL